MRNLKLFLVLISFSLLLSCDKDNDDIELAAIEANQLNLILQQGSWEISEFKLNESDKTADYADYIFTFEENNNLKATSEVDQIIGTWRVSTDSGSTYDSYYDVDFNLFFSGDSKFKELTNNYDIISATAEEIKLNLQVDENTNTATLTFIKN